MENNRFNRQSRRAVGPNCCQNATSCLILATPGAMVVWKHFASWQTIRSVSLRQRIGRRQVTMERSVPFLGDNRAMKRTLVILALASVVLGTSGCGCCRDAFAKKSQPAPAPVYSQCAPMCAPACVPCDPCASSGDMATYGYGSTPSYGYGSSPTMMTMPQSMPMMAPSDCNCVQ